MSRSPSILLLHEPGDVPADLAAIARALTSLGAHVDVRVCAEPYADLLLLIAEADKTVFWR